MNDIDISPIHASTAATQTRKMGGGARYQQVLAQLWKQAAIGVAFGSVVGLTYYQTVAKQDMKKIATYYAEQDSK